jgi:hypothetical protein
MNKRGLIGKILLIVGIIILVIGIIIGVTAYQLYSLANLAQKEIANIQQDSSAISKGDCTKVPSMENSINNLIISTENACKNPIVVFIFSKQTIQAENLGTLNCDTIPKIKAQSQDSISQIKAICANQTIMDAIKKQTTNVSK